MDQQEHCYAETYHENHLATVATVKSCMYVSTSTHAPSRFHQELTSVLPNRLSDVSVDSPWTSWDKLPSETWQVGCLSAASRAACTQDDQSSQCIHTMRSLKTRFEDDHSVIQGRPTFRSAVSHPYLTLTRAE